MPFSCQVSLLFLFFSPKAAQAANISSNSADKLNTLHDCSRGSEEGQNESSKLKWRSEVQIASTIEPFSPSVGQSVETLWPEEMR